MGFESILKIVESIHIIGFIIMIFSIYLWSAVMLLTSLIKMIKKLKDE